MESKQLSSLYLCGDDSEENAFGGISSFDNLDDAVPDNLGYENLPNCHLGMPATDGAAYFSGNSCSENFPTDRVGDELDRSRQSAASFGLNNSNSFTSADSNRNVERISDGSFTGFSETFHSESLPNKKISNTGLRRTSTDMETTENQIMSSNSYADLGTDGDHLSYRSNTSCGYSDAQDNSILNATGENFRGCSSLGKKRSRDDEQERRFVNGETSSNDDTDYDYDEDGNALLEHNGKEGREFNEEEEEMEEDDDDDTEEEEDEEEHDEDPLKEGTSAELFGDEKLPLDDVIDEKPTEEMLLNAEMNLLQQSEFQADEGDAPELPPPTETKKRPKKPRKKKAKLDPDSKQEGDEKPKKKRRRREKGSESGKHKSEFGGIRRSNFERKNIRKILDDNLDEETKAAQKEEMERKQRLLEIQEKLRQQALELRAQREKEMLNNSNMEKLKNSALKSLLEEKAESPSSGVGDLMRSHGTMVSRPQKAPDVVEISSSDEEDNDIIMMSEEEEEEDDEEDLENSGSHVNDALNRPDAQGCVLVNVGHPTEEPDIFLAPQLASVVKPHQIGGIRFLYDNVVESIDRYKTSNGFGCILAHSMGLGKTIQVIAFIDIFLRHTGARSALIIVPVNTLQNWINEFNMWLPTVDEENRASIDSEILWPREFKLYIINDNMKLTTARAKVVADWHQTGGVLLLGYEMYRLLIKTKGIVTKPKRSAKKTTAEPVVIDVEEEECNKELVKGLHEALMRPGPDLVICDEGHRIKNSHASISQVLKNIRTRRRVVLTGYPLQNNLLEYWCMVDFVRPNYLGTKTEFCNMFERPIMNGQCVDSTPSDVKLMRFRAHVLHSMLEGFVQRRGHAVLQAALPVKEEYVILIRMSPIQRKLYNEFMSSIKDSGLTSWNNSNNPIKAFSVCCKIWNHPDILYQIVEQRKDDNDLDIEDTKAATDVPVAQAAAATPGKSKGKGKQKSNQNSSNSQPPSVPAPAQPIPQSVNALPGMPPMGPGTLPLVPGMLPAMSGMMPSPMAGGMGSPALPSVSMAQGVAGSPASVSVGLSAGGSVAMSTAVPAIAASEIKTEVDATVATTTTTTTVAPVVFEKKESQVISYDWANDLMKDYAAGIADHSGKMIILLDIIEDSVAIGDKILVFSQSLFTLSLIEEYLSKRIIPGTEETWTRNRNYFRLDGSTSGIDREKLINQFNDDNNNKIHLFLLSTRAGCLGINLVGASRVVIFDASWNPCHDCQAVCRVYRYGQTKSCYVYRLVTDNTMEKNIYDRQINKQGISDRVVDELNPQNLLSRKQVDILMRYEDADLPTIDASDYDTKCSDALLAKIVQRHHGWITKEPFTHESLLLDRKDQKLTKQEKRLAKQGYEMEKKMSSFGLGRPSYSAFYQKNADGMPIMRYGTSGGRPVASVRPMMSTPIPMNRSTGNFQNRLFGQTFGTTGMKPGVSVQQVQTTTDIIIPPTNTSSDSAPSKIPAGEKVLIIKTPKGVYIRTSHGKIFAVRTASKTTATTTATTTAAAASSSTTTTATTSQATRKTTTSTTARATSASVSFVSTVTGSTATNTQSAVKSLTTSTSTAVPSSTTASESVTTAASTASSSASANPIPVSSQLPQKSVSDARPTVQPTVDAPVKLVPHQNPVVTQPPRIPVLPAVVSNSSNTKASTMSSSLTSSITSDTAKVVSSAVSMVQMNPVAGITHSVGNFSAPQPQSQPPKIPSMASVSAPGQDRPDHEPMWDRTPGFDDLLSDTDDLNTSIVHSSLDQHHQQQPQHQQQPSAPSESFYHGFLGAPRNSPTLIHNSNESQASSSRQSLSSSKPFTPVEHRPPQNVPPRHPMPMAPPYLPPAMGPYGMPSPYPWMPSMPPMWMQPMGRMGMDAFPDAFGTTSESSDFGNDMNFDDLGSDDRSFSSLLLGNDNDDILGRRGAAKTLDTAARVSSSAYRQNASLPYSSGMGGYPYHPYPYNMPQGGYYPPPPHPSSNPLTQGTSSSMNRGYIPMHYPTPMPASHMGMHPGYMPPPGMMPSYDMSPSAVGRNIPGKKNEFDLKDN